MHECIKEIETIKKSGLFQEEINAIEQYIKDIENENWQTAYGFDNYEVSTLGRIRNIKNKKIKKQTIDKYGYCHVTFYEKNIGWRSMQVHRLVAIAFIPNIKCKEQVNHKNGIKTDNRVENLEWVSCKENIQHAHTYGLSNTNHLKSYREKVSKPVAQLDNFGKVIATYKSIDQAAKSLNVSSCNISYACHHSTRTAKGFHWKFIAKENIDYAPNN